MRDPGRQSRSLQAILTAAAVLVGLAGCGNSNSSAVAGPSFQVGTPDTSGQLGDATNNGGTDAGQPVKDTSSAVDVGSADAGTPDAGSPPPLDVAQPAPDAGGAKDAGPKPDSNAPCTFDAAAGPTGQECPAGETCLPDVGTCKGKVKGLCKKLVTNCPTQVNAVCGCDDITYINVCEAQKAGKIIAAGGKCDTPLLTPCGGNGGGKCPMGQVCDIEGCQPGDGGFCHPEPAGGLCPNGGVSECGCDDKTYPNGCYRRMAGVAKKQAGECPVTTIVPCKIGPAGKVIGNCGPNHYCKTNPGNPDTCLGDGMCSPIPPVCDKTVSQVCSCGGFSPTLDTYVDSKTYNNACELAKTAINMKSAGACGGTTGGCTEGQGGCPATHYCGVPKGACGTKGICIPKPPPPCPNSISLVCGCDGKTYSNAGCAAEGGVVVKYDGACQP